MAKGDKLAEKQSAFVREYLKDLNATRAAKSAGYSEKTAYSQGVRLLRNVKVATAIQAAMDKRAERTELTADKVLKNIEEVRQLALDAGEHNNALKALELQGKHLKLFTDRVEAVGGTALEINLTRNK